MRTVYRLEKREPSGALVGPYNVHPYGEAQKALLRAHACPQGRKVNQHRPPPDNGSMIPWMDSKKIFGVEALSGCSSLEQLKDWFGEHFEPLIRAGFFVSEYEVPQTRILWEDAQQLVFAPYEASTALSMEEVPF
jgi:hypothetical protein